VARGRPARPGRDRRPGGGQHLGPDRRGLCQGGDRPRRRRAAVGRRRGAVEVNLSCPNLEGGRHLFAQSPSATADAIDAAGAAGLPLWAKLTPNVTDIVEIAGAAVGAGAEALTLVNTLLGMAIDVEARAYVLGVVAGGGGLSGPAIRPVAVRAVHDVHAALPGIPIVGVGGVARGVDAVELLLAGASAVQVGTATFADPRAPWRVLRELKRWCRRHRVRRVSDLVGTVHDR
jgi:dihydroorotate dehydrogenase (NAD+) catalytic subunit